VTNLDFKNLAIGVEKRLDEIFADELKGYDPQIKKVKHLQTRSLANLKNIIMALEWEVSIDYLNDLIQELSRLKRAYNKDSQVQKLLQLLSYLGRYIKVHQDNTHPEVFNMLFQAYNGLIKIASEKYSSHQKAKIVNHLIMRYLSLKSQLKQKNKNVYRNKINNIKRLKESLSPPVASVSKPKKYPFRDSKELHYQNKNSNNRFQELKKFIHLEIEKLRKEIQSIKLSIQKEESIGKIRPRF
jgi:hypothetical protein